MKKKIVTHNADFHADDVLAVATLCLLFGEENIEIIRTRDKSLFETADYVVDVGRVYDSSRNRFDHHQEGWNEKRENGVPYASFGLVWKKYGVELCQSEDVAFEIDNKLVVPVDANDNGVSLSKSLYEDISEYSFSQALTSFNKNWDENVSNDDNFLKAVSFAKTILKEEIRNAKASQNARKRFADLYKDTPDKRYAVFDIYSTSWKKDVHKYPELLFVVHPYGDTWALRTVRKENGSFENRKSLPESWAGKEGEELQKITGVSDALFCHNKLFMANVKTKEGALKLLDLALK